jgi:NhaA family Na+:H+ antiporter
VLRNIRRFIQNESSAGVVLAFAALAALIISNSSLAPLYQQWLTLPGELHLGVGAWSLQLSKPALVWINDLWMAVFFFLVGMEIKRELVEGELATWRQAMLPLGAAAGGMLVPALIYALFNSGDAVAMRGWAIPTATDIAFALGILMLLGSRVPSSLKVFLTAVAIIDDLGAIVIIALFYTAELHMEMLLGALLCIATLWALNRGRVSNVTPYALVGLVLWLFVLKSGVHATLAGVITAMAIPLRGPEGQTPLASTEHALHPWVAFVVLPVFAFSNAGVSLQGIQADVLLQAVPLGIATGLVVGKTIGVFGASWLLVKLAGSQFPAGATRLQFLALCMLCGIGFTMSLFIGGLAFDGHGEALAVELKLGVLCGSVVSAVLGAALMVMAKPAAR